MYTPKIGEHCIARIGLTDAEIDIDVILLAWYGEDKDKAIVAAVEGYPFKNGYGNSILIDGVRHHRQAIVNESRLIQK